MSQLITDNNIKCPHCQKTNFSVLSDHDGEYHILCLDCSGKCIIDYGIRQPKFGYITDVRVMLDMPLAEWWTGYNQKEAEELAISIIEVKLDIHDKWISLNEAYNKPRKDNHVLADTLIGKPARISHSFVYLLKNNDRDWYTYEAFCDDFNPFDFVRKDFPSEEKLNVGDWS